MLPLLRHIGKGAAQTIQTIHIQHIARAQHIAHKYIIFPLIILVADIFKQEPIILHRLQHPLPHSATALLLLKHPGIAQIHCLSPRFDFYIENLFQQPLLSNGLNNHFRHIINHFIGHTRIYTNPECIFHNEICIF